MARLHGFAPVTGGFAGSGCCSTPATPNRAQRNQESFAYFRFIPVIDADRMPVAGIVSAGLGRRIKI
jgi:hypothetical protein